MKDPDDLYDHNDPEDQYCNDDYEDSQHGFEQEPQPPEDFSEFN